MKILKNKFLFFLPLLTSTTCLTSPGGIQMPQAIIPLKERIEKDCKTRFQKAAEKGEMYNIETLLAQDKFQNASVSEKKIYSIAHLKDYKNKIVREVLQFFLIKSIAVIVIIASSSSVFLYSLTKIKEKVRSLLGISKPISTGIMNMDPVDIYFNMVFGLALSTLGSFLFKEGNELITLLGFKYNPEKLYQNLAPLEERYISVKWFLRDKHQDYIQRIESSLIDLRIHPERYSLVKLVSELLDTINIDRNDGYLFWDEELADKVLSGFRPHIKKQLKELAFVMMLRVNLYKLTGKRELLTCLLYGEPGTGKTMSILKIIKELLGLDAILVNLGVPAEVLFGSQNKRPGTLTQGIISVINKKHGDCAVCVFDDGDRALNSQKIASSWHLELLDNTKKYYRDYYFGVNILEPFIKIFTGNYGNEIDRAAKNRFSFVIYFDNPFTKEGIKMILDGYMNSLINKYKALPYSVTKEDFTSQEFESFKQEAIKESDRKDDKGLRTAIYYVEKYFHRKIKQKYDVMLKETIKEQKTT